MQCVPVFARSLEVNSSTFEPLYEHVNRCQNIYSDFLTGLLSQQTRTAAVDIVASLKLALKVVFTFSSHKT